MTLSTTVTIKKNNLPELEEFLDTLDGASVRVGFEGQHSGGVSNAELAYLLEHGSPARNLPARPAVRPGIRAHKQELARAAYQATYAAMRAPKSRKQVLLAGLQHYGDVAVDAVKQQIYRNDFVPLAPATVRRKGHDQAWIDTGELINSLTATVAIGKGYRRRVKG